MSSTPAVELRGIGKRFPGVIANYDVDLNVRAGTIHAIVGEMELEINPDEDALRNARA